MNEKKTDELLKVGVIGTGNCGGQMADAAAAEGFDGIVINASSKDLGLLKNTLSLFPVGDGRGTGKNRDEAKEFFTERINLVQDPVFMKFIDDHDVIVIPTSIGGGFGSGSSLVLAAVLMEITDDKLIMPVGVLPFDDELYTAQTHAIAWLKELEGMNCSYMLYDNNRFADTPKMSACERVNKQFVEDLKVMRGDYLRDTRSGGIDNRDMMTALSAGGRVVIHTIPLLEAADVVEDSLIRTIEASIIVNSAHAELVNDKVIWASAVMYALHDEFDKYKASIKSDIQKEFGVHINDYDNFADLERGEDVPDTMSIVLCGLTMPNGRINKMIERRDSLEKQILAQQKAASKLNSASSGNSALQINAKKFGGSKPEGKKDVSSILSKYISDQKK